MITFETALQAFLNNQSIPATRLREAIYYVLFPGGKRLRPQLVYAVGQLVNLPIETLHPIAIAIELMHAYSLVHDDLPAMDNDDFRRGQPTCHKAFDEATAILVGDALQSLAISALIQMNIPSVSLHQIQILLQSSGPAGMISGQCLDLTLLSHRIDESLLRTIHQLKTSELLLACVNMVLATLPPEQQAHYAFLSELALHLGLAYQMQDDYLDAYQTENHGKGHCSDGANDKHTFTSLYTEPELKVLINKTFDEAKAILVPFKSQAAKLYGLINTMHQLKG